MLGTINYEHICPYQCAGMAIRNLRYLSSRVVAFVYANAIHLFTYFNRDTKYASIYIIISNRMSGKRDAIFANNRLHSLIMFIVSNLHYNCGSVGSVYVFVLDFNNLLLNKLRKSIEIMRRARR